MATIEQLLEKGKKSRVNPFKVIDTITVGFNITRRTQWVEFEHKDKRGNVDVIRKNSVGFKDFRNVEKIIKTFATKTEMEEIKKKKVSEPTATEEKVK